MAKKEIHRGEYREEATQGSLGTGMTEEFRAKEHLIECAFTATPIRT